jgi:hypothetical protein
MKRMDSPSAANAELGALIGSGTFGLPVLGAWIYGGRALDPESQADVDVVVVLRDDSVPRRLSWVLQDDVPASLNIIGPNSLGKHSVRHNGGFFFTAKLLAPRKLILGDPLECRHLLAGAFAHMLNPWALYLLENSSDGEGLSAEQALALLFMTKIRINWHYLRYLVKWRLHRRFATFWGGTEELVQQSIAGLRESGRDLGEASGRLFRAGHPGGLSSAQKQVWLEFLNASFWQFNGWLRRRDEAFLDGYFRKQSDMIGSLPIGAIEDAMAFLHDTLRRPTLSIY